MTLEMGQRIVEGRKEVDLCARIFDYSAETGELGIHEFPNKKLVRVIR
jgi:acyl-CoA reductase-like NAD-dependent aldehyde dehydrogenase